MSFDKGTLFMNIHRHPPSPATSHLHMLCLLLSTGVSFMHLRQSQYLLINIIFKGK